jgi:hypothetical protein
MAPVSSSSLSEVEDNRRDSCSVLGGTRRVGGTPNKSSPLLPFSPNGRVGDGQSRLEGRPNDKSSVL